MAPIKSSGFTLVELVMTIVILSIVSATALPKFFSRNSYAERVFFDDTLNALRYAQKIAVATGCNVQVSIAANSYSLKRQGSSSSGSCPGGTLYDLSVIHPGTQDTNYTGSEAGVTLTSTSAAIIFSSLGTASADVTLTLNGSRTISVVAKTGYVYDSS